MITLTWVNNQLLYVRQFVGYVASSSALLQLWPFYSMCNKQRLVGSKGTVAFVGSTSLSVYLEESFRHRHSSGLGTSCEDRLWGSRQKSGSDFLESFTPSASTPYSAQWPDLRALLRQWINTTTFISFQDPCNWESESESEVWKPVQWIPIMGLLMIYKTFFF